jgi:predicted PurR-regulated permease PerM
MPHNNRNRSWQNAILVLTSTIVAAVVVACLYWAQTIFIPLAMAVYLTFLLSPLVSALQRRGLRRVPAALLTLLLAVLVLGAGVYLVTTQVTSLATRLPRYSATIQTKVNVISDRLDSLTRAVNGALGIHPDEEPEAGPRAAERPMPVVVKPDTPPWLSRLPALLVPAAQGLGGAALALVLTGFMLIKREDMRNRLIRLAGRGRITLATRILDEAGHRISRFLVVQAMISAIAGVSIGLGLLLLGVEYALLWGFLIFLLRYIPYVGIWFAALPPVLLSFAMYPGWTTPLLVVGLIFVVEMICGNVLEPWLFGRSMGVSEVSLLVAAAFWAFLWGPIGMVLSSPLTVCLVVLGKYYPRLKFIDVLLGDEPALAADVSFYQRLLARDQDEASDIAVARLQEPHPLRVFDELLIPTLVYAKRDRDRDDLHEDDEDFILSATVEIGEDVAERLFVPPAETDPTEPTPPRMRLLACPAHDGEDEAALTVLTASLDAQSWSSEVVPSDKVASLLVSAGDDRKPDVICLAALPPVGLAHARYLCKRLHARFPQAKILVARWGVEAGRLESSAHFTHAGAAAVHTTFNETREALLAEQQARASELEAPAGAPRRERQTTAV